MMIGDVPTARPYTATHRLRLSATALQLLGNLGSVRHNLENLGKEDIVRQLDRYLVFLQEKFTHELDFLLFASAALGWVYRTLPDQERFPVLRNCRPADRPSSRHAYAPKAEVQYFCEVIEPLILALQQRGHCYEVR